MPAKDSVKFHKIKKRPGCTEQIFPIKTEKPDPEKKDRVILIGNPNVGKSVIFGHLTGTYVTVSNYPGTTVEITTGNASYDGKKTAIIDTPGVNNLIPMSEDEIVTRDILLKETPRSVVHIADAKNLRRSLFITLQLIEMEIPLILDINMVDEAQERGIHIDSRKLSEKLGIPVFKTVATRKQGMSALINSINDSPKKSDFSFSYSPEIEQAIVKLEALLPSASISKRSLALMILSKDTSLNEWLFSKLNEGQIQKINKIFELTQAKFNSHLSFLITQQRMEFLRNILDQVLQEEKKEKSQVIFWLENKMIHPVYGLGFVLGVLFLFYEFVGVFGAGTLVDFVENILFGSWLLPQLTKFLEWIVPWPLVQDFLIGEYGLVTMALTYAIAIILPIVTTFFLAFALLEDSGYLPRLSVMVNRLFRSIGLNGKAVLPMILGLGCDTMATLTTRILDSKKERIIVTLLLALGIPCSAQLGVILGMLGGISPIALIIWAGTIFIVLIIVGYLSSKIIPGESSDFILELPPLRKPGILNILTKTVARIEWYIKEAVPLFVLGTLVLFILDKFNLIGIIQDFSAPVVQKFLQLPPKATEAFLIGFLRRDYGVAGLFSLAQTGELSTIQIIVSLVTITLFVPCIANFFIIIKERGLKTALVIVAFIVPFAFIVGGVVNFILRLIGFGG